VAVSGGRNRIPAVTDEFTWKVARNCEITGKTMQICQVNPINQQFNAARIPQTVRITCAGHENLMLTPRSIREGTAHNPANRLNCQFPALKP
jgi:hypothetical protein